MNAHRSAVLVFAATALLLTTATDLTAQSAYTVQAVGPQNVQVYPQWMNDAGDVAGYYYPTGFQRAFLQRNGVFTDIGTLGGSYTSPQNISASGVVVGYSYLPGDNSYHAFLFDGTIHDLGTLNSGYSYAYAVNASGQVVGTTGVGAFLYSGGVMTRLLDLVPAGSGWSHLYEGRDINDAGQITGRGVHNGTLRAFLFTPAVGASPATIVAFGDGNTSPQWLNQSGQVAGQHYISPNNRAFLFTPGAGGGTLQTLPTLGGTYSYPYDLNDAGQVVGYSYVAGDSVYHAFIYSNGQITDLGTAQTSTYSYPIAVNNSGVVIGYSNGPFVYSGGVMRQLNSLLSGCNWSGSNPQSINNAGQIAGYGYHSSSGSRAFIMTPATGNVASAVVAYDASGSYRSPIQLQARLTAECSALFDKTVSFSLNGSPAGSAQTDQDGWARLTTNLGNIVVGSYTDGIEATFVGDASAPAASDTANLFVYPATPVITWNPAAIVEGTPLGAAQLNATADAPGTFSYSPGAGTVLGPGLRRLFASFSPADTANYNFTSAQAYLAVRASSPSRVYSAEEVTGLGGTYTEVLSFNNAGQAVGYSYLPGNSFQHAFLFSNGVTTDLGTLGGQYSYAQDINDAGDVTGYAQTTQGYQHAFVYRNGQMIDLGSLLGVGHSQGIAINANGDVALYNNSASRAFIYRAATNSFTDLGDLPGGYTQSYPSDVNASGQVVGYSYPNTSCYHAFLTVNDVMQDLGTLGGQCSQATAINDAGQVVGWAYNASNRQRAFIYTNGAMVELGTLGGADSYAVAINSAGVVTGYSLTANGQWHAFSYANGVMTDLGAINQYSQGYDINDGGTVVGWGHSAQFDQTAFVYDGGVMHDLNTLINVGETAGVNEARFVNNPGQIVARAYGSTNRWYILTPATLASSTLALAASAGTYQGTTTLTAALGVANPAGASVQFRLNGVVVGSATSDANGFARLENVPLGTMSVATHANAASATFVGTAEYGGSTATADVIISKAAATITLGSLTHTFNGLAKAATAVTNPTGVGGVSITYNGSSTLPTAAGSYAVVATLSNANYEASDATGTLIINKATATLTLGSLSHTYDGSAKSATVTSNPAVGSVAISYNSSATVPTNAGSYTVVATLTDNNYSASATATLTIAKATQAIVVTTGAPSTAGVGSSFTVAATGGGSANAVVITTPAGDGCSDVGPTFTVTSVAACQVTYNQAGNTNYLAAPQIVQVVTPIGYGFQGFFSPIDMSTPTMTVWNRANAGQAIPVKWRLTVAGQPVTATSSFVGLFSYEVNCSTGTSEVEDVIEEYAASASGLVYDGDGQFHFNWRTPTTYKNKCRAMYVSFSDGSVSPIATFKFR